MPEIRQITLREPHDSGLWRSMLLTALTMMLGKEIAVTVREKGLHEPVVYPEPYNLTLEKIEGDKVYFSLPISKIVSIDEQRY